MKHEERKRKKEGRKEGKKERKKRQKNKDGKNVHTYIYIRSTYICAYRCAHKPDTSSP